MLRGREEAPRRVLLCDWCDGSGESNDALPIRILIWIREYLPTAREFRPIESIAAMTPTLSYQVFFARNTSEAIVELNRDAKRTLRATLRNLASPPPKAFLRSRETFMGAWDGIKASSFILCCEFRRQNCLLDPSDSILFERARGLLCRKIQQARV